MPYSFVLTGGGSGGHVFPALAVAQVLRARGHHLLFVGTRQGMEARLVPQAGYDMEFIQSGALNRVGLRKQIQTAFRLPGGVAVALRILQRVQPRAVFSTGGFVAGPVAVAAILKRIPLIVMEPNAIPGVANRKIGKRVYRALLGFESARAWFPPAKSEVTGLPVRREFFSVSHKSGGPFTVLITGASQGARSINRACRESWPLFQKAGSPVYLLHQTGVPEHREYAEAFAHSGLSGSVVPFIDKMAEAFTRADLVVGRSGAGGVNEIAAAGMASVLVPLPFAADDHQRRNAEALVEAGAAHMILDRELNGARLFEEIESLRTNPAELDRMRERVRQFAKPGAAERAAEVLEEAAAR